MIQAQRKVLVVYHGSYHQSLAIFDDYLSGILTVYPDSRLLDYFELYLRYGAKGFNESIMAEVVEHGSELIFFLPSSGDLTLSAGLLEKLSEKACIVMNFFDSELFFERIDRHYAQAAELVLVPSPASCLLYSAIGLKAHCTFSLFNPERYPHQKLEPSIDVSFIGNVTKAGRRKYIDALKLKGIEVVACGYGTSAGIINHRQMVHLFNITKINLNFTEVQESDLLIYARKGTPLTTQLKGRITEIALTGGFVLTEYATGLEEMYEIGKEIETFHDMDELLQKIRYYLVHDTERRTIASLGRKRALQDHNSQTAFRHIATLLPDQNQRRRINCDDEFIHNQANFPFYYFIHFVLCLKLAKAFYEIRYIRTIAQIDFRQAAHLGIRAFAAFLRKNNKLTSLYDSIKLSIVSKLKDKHRVKMVTTNINE